MNWSFTFGSMFGWFMACLYFWALAAWQRRRSCLLKTFDEDKE